ncbi:MAG: acetyl-CoA carboxylase, biotin carboxyl carrier protein [Flavobacteriales bacterium]|nr:MAG: acetyl-CoA carboxylase, biotin carboxyl carrier protein [Flavobacteriales bacterium]
MDLKDIQELIKFVAKSGVIEVDLETSEFKINIKTPARKRKGQEYLEPEVAVVHAQIPAGQTLAAVQPVVTSATTPIHTPAEEPENQTENKEASPKASEDDKYITIKSPMIGTFYRSSSPDKPPFVNVGDDISEGKVICIIEAMKLFNEIEAEVSGKVVKVLVDDATPVEYDQPLLLVDPA